MSIETIWHPVNNVIIERDIWATVLVCHMAAGVVPVDVDILARLHQTRTTVDLESIERRERITRHDLKARLEEAVAVAGIPEVLHLGMTSADVVENAYLIRMAQTCDHFELQWDQWLPFRGIKGPVGTQQDQLDLLGSHAACTELDIAVASYFGFSKIANSVPQVMYRSIDLEWATNLIGHVRPQGMYRHLANGYLTMIAENTGTTWNEGDVSGSVVRRVALPNLAHTLNQYQQETAT